MINHNPQKMNKLRICLKTVVLFGFSTNELKSGFCLARKILTLTNKQNNLHLRNSTLEFFKGSFMKALNKCFSIKEACLFRS